MNRKKLKRQLLSKPVTLTTKEVDKLKQQATDNAAAIINLFPLLILRDKFGFGKVRIERYLEYFAELLETYNAGYFDLKDIEKVLHEELGLKFEWGNEKNDKA